MPITYEVCPVRSDRASFSRTGNSALEKIKKTWSQRYRIEVVGATDPSEVDAVMAGNAPDLPDLATHVYRDKETGNIFPYFTAKRKSVERDENNGLVFWADIEYDDETGDAQNQSPPANAENIPPVLTWGVEAFEEGAWESNDSKMIRLPTGTLYGVPVVRELPSLVATVTQFENTFSRNNLEDRMYSVNSDTWQSKGARKWKITDIKYQNVVVPIAGDITMNSVKVVYTIKSRDYTIKDLEDAGTVTDLSCGWDPVRIRADSKYLMVANDMSTVKLALAGQHMGLNSVYLKTDGTVHLKANQLKVPPHDTFEVQEATTYNGFLRV